MQQEDKKYSIEEFTSIVKSNNGVLKGMITPIEYKEFNNFKVEITLPHNSIIKKTFFRVYHFKGTPKKIKRTQLFNFVKSYPEFKDLEKGMMPIEVKYPIYLLANKIYEDEYQMLRDFDLYIESELKNESK